MTPNRPGDWLFSWMSLATVSSAALQGIDAVPVTVEVNGGESGDPRLILVGLPDAAVKESDDRVFSGVGFLPEHGYRVGDRSGGRDLHESFRSAQ